MEAEQEAVAEEPNKKKSPILLIIILAVVALLTIVLVFVAMMLLFGGGDDEEMMDDGAAAPQQQAEQPAESAPQRSLAPSDSISGPIVELSPFVVNLADPGGQRYLKIAVVLELSPDDKKLPATVDMNRPKIRDAIIGVLSSKSYDEISTFKGKENLKQEMLDRLNRFMGGGVVRVYYREFVVQ